VVLEVDMRVSGRIRLAAAAAAVALVALPAAPGAAATEDAGGGGMTFTVGITQDIDSLNPFTGIVASAYEVYQLVYDTLTSYGQEDFSAQPSLAQSWETSEDGLTWTYTIRSGVTWSDGEPLTAADVAYSFNRVRNGKYERTNWGNYVANVTSVEAPDDTTVVMTVRKPTPVMLHPSLPILPKHVWEEIDGKEVSDYRNEPGPDGIVGSGPFVLTEYRKGQFIRLRANQDYWGGAPKVDELVFRVFNNQDSMAQALKRGEIDFADSLEANIFDALEGSDGIETVPAEYSGFNEIAFNYGAALDDGTPIGDGHPALKDRDVRLAIAHAIDREALVDRVLGGYGSPGTSVIPPIYADLHYDPAGSTYAFDLAEAERILDDAGYERGPDGVRTMPDGDRKLSFRLHGRSNSQGSQRTVQFVQGWLEEIGIEVKPKIVSEDALYEVIGNGTFDLFEWGWVVEPDPDYQMSTFTCANRSYKDGGTVYANLSDSFYCNEEYDRLYAQQAEQIDPAERAETVKAMQQMLYEDIPYVVTYYYDNLEAYRSDRFDGFKPQPAPDGSLLFQYGVYSYLSIDRPRQAAAGGGGGSGGTGSSDDGLGTGAVAGIVGGTAVVLVAAGLLVARSRRSPSDEVE
jgi:peptide/nickel transport system substrate-binding protein